jgi:hypothetical protein
MRTCPQGLDLENKKQGEGVFSLHESAQNRGGFVKATFLFSLPLIVLGERAALK